jgi:hypothetical protein
LSREVSDFERARAEAFATFPTEAERLVLICETVAEVERGRVEWFKAFADTFERARSEWLASFVARGTGPE